MKVDENVQLLERLREIDKSEIKEVSKKYNIPMKTLRIIRDTPKGSMVNKNYPYKSKIRRKAYEEKKSDLQVELVKLQNWMRKTGNRVVMIFEGRDAAGKGGTIKRFTEHLNPRGARVVALEKPSVKELGQWYFQRYIQHLPTSGEMVFFDRSWYNRAGVEKVMGFCSPQEYLEFIEQVSAFEKMLINSGITVVKFWFSVSREEQLRRFISRTHDPLKQWKLSPMDVASLGRWEEYTEAKESMFYHTDKSYSPWNVIRSDDKKRARLNAMRHVLDQFDYDNKDHRTIIPIDHQIIGRAENIYEPDELIHRGFFSKK
ncbi:MAG: polyphosphate kinase 2 [Halobacteriovoraceae bacterium]|mgnify:CR=1 FL=1|jgi:polyphosphate kinase|nr:polyphosphate kinase 2 [Halobacteriovoraceae bacterium]